jgi:polar amino acid transport system permease protein
VNKSNTEVRSFLFGMFAVSATLFIVFAFSYGKKTPIAIVTLFSMSSSLLTGAPAYQSLGGGFSANIIISLWAMVLSTIGGFLLGGGLLSKNDLVRKLCRLLMNFLRNSPWLVILYAMLYLIPFEIVVFKKFFELSPAIKAVIGLSLPISANIAEVFRAGIDSIQKGQWDATTSLGYTRKQALYGIILPQALPLMIPGIMTVYASLFIGTSLVVITGTNDVLSVAKVIIASGADDYATAIYIFVLFLFFAYAFPIAMTSRWLERRVRSNR